MRVLLHTERLSIRSVAADDWKRVVDIWEDFRRSPYAEYDGIPTTDEATVRSKVRQ